jgi:hypothetical protein
LGRREYFSAKEQCFSLTANRHKHQYKPNFSISKQSFLLIFFNVFPSVPQKHAIPKPVWYSSALLVEQLSFDFGSMSSSTGEAKVVLEKCLFTVDRREGAGRS